MYPFETLGALINCCNHREGLWCHSSGEAHPEPHLPKNSISWSLNDTYVIPPCHLTERESYSQDPWTIPLCSYLRGSPYGYTSSVRTLLAKGLSNTANDFTYGKVGMAKQRQKSPKSWNTLGWWKTYIKTIPVWSREGFIWELISLGCNSCTHIAGNLSEAQRAGKERCSSPCWLSWISVVLSYLQGVVRLKGGICFWQVHSVPAFSEPPCPTLDRWVKTGMREKRWGLFFNSLLTVIKRTFHFEPQLLVPFFNWLEINSPKPLAEGMIISWIRWEGRETVRKILWHGRKPNQ